MEFYNNKMSPRFDMNDFLQLRSRPTSYMVFCKHFLKCVTRKTKFDSNIKTAKTYNDVCTVSDEAFALLLLENSWDRWCDLYAKDPTSLLPKRGGRQRDDRLLSAVKTKYTQGGHKYFASGDGSTTGSTSSKSGKGWSLEGMLRYNELFDLVEADRVGNPEFLDLLLDEMKESKAKPKKSPAAKQSPSFPIRHNLFKKKSMMSPLSEVSSQCHDASRPTEDEDMPSGVGQSAAI